MARFEIKNTKSEIEKVSEILWGSIFQNVFQKLHTRAGVIYFQISKDAFQTGWKLRPKQKIKPKCYGV